MPHHYDFFPSGYSVIGADRLHRRAEKLVSEHAKGGNSGETVKGTLQALLVIKKTSAIAIGKAKEEREVLVPLPSFDGIHQQSVDLPVGALAISLIWQRRPRVATSTAEHGQQPPTVALETQIASLLGSSSDRLELHQLHANGVKSDTAGAAPTHCNLQRCPLGTYKARNRAAPSPSPSSRLQMGRCLPCGAGRYSDPAGIACLPCPPHTYLFVSAFYCIRLWIQTISRFAREIIISAHLLGTLTATYQRPKRQLSSLILEQVAHRRLG